MNAFDKALAQTLGFEGGWSNALGDRGGPTNYGITQRTYDAWRVTTGQPGRTVELITDEEVKAIYFADYWTPCRCEEMPEALALAVFDMAVNSGVYNATLTLQRTLGVKPDGVIGPVTLKAAEQTEPAAAVLRFLKKRGAFLQDVIDAHPGDVRFLGGWISRLLDQVPKGATA